MFGKAGQKLTYRIRSRMFEALLKQEMAYYDRKEHGVGSLCAKLSDEAASVQGVSNALLTGKFVMCKVIDYAGDRTTNRRYNERFSHARFCPFPVRLL